VTNIGAQIWEFHIGNNGNHVSWSNANDQAIDHGLWGSNNSRLPSFAEGIALYAANFGGDNPGGKTVGAVQPLSNVGSTNPYVDAEDNRPDGWHGFMWTAAPTPSGHARQHLHFGNVLDSPDDAFLQLVSAVL
jgi:hypothetical protein